MILPAPPAFLLTSSTSTPDLRVKEYTAEEQLQQALEGSDIVIIPAGVPR
ncbi:hypothetical protein OROGR_007322 [Orobanche gracilis]